MKFVEFETIWRRMCMYYEKPGYLENKEMVDIYFNEMKYINNNYQEFEQLLRNKCKFWPKTADIVEVRKELIDKMLEEQHININEPVCECKLCNGTGYRIIKDKKMRNYAVACDCKNGDTKLYDGRKIVDKAHRSIYIIPRYSQLFPTEVKR